MTKMIKKMKAQDEVIETLKLLDEESILRLYELAMALRNKKQSVTSKGLNMVNIRKAQRILSSIKGSLSDDIQIEREERC